MMLEKEPYVGTLSLEAASIGCLAAKKNGIELISDSKLLFDNERYSRSLSLSVLAIEEFHKPNVIREVILHNNVKDSSKSWRQFRLHSEKGKNWILPNLIKQGMNFEGLISEINKSNDHVNYINRLKQRALYTDCVGKSEWSIPSNVITKEKAEMFLQAANEQLEGLYDEFYSPEALRIYKQMVLSEIENSQIEERVFVLKYVTTLHEKGLLGDHVYLTLTTFMNQ